MKVKTTIRRRITGELTDRLNINDPGPTGCPSIPVIQS